MYQIKQKPEDFIVEELPIYNLEEGPYAYFWMKKTNYNTIDAIRRIAEKLKLSLKDIGFAGTKDRQAVTNQIISIKEGKRAENIELKDIELEFIGNGKKPISLGDLKGNKFKIVVDNIEDKEYPIPKKLPNLFGPQRFSKNNTKIGKFLVKKDFKSALGLINNNEVKEFLKKSPNNFVGALRLIPLKIRKIYIHAYQSFLWNKTAERYIELFNPEESLKIPLIGYGTDIESMDYDLKELILDVMEKESITERDFIIPQIKELSSEGGERDLFVLPENLEIKKENNKAIVSFFLPKGSYATVIIEKIFNPE